jgi:GT2 family glycosyltransferase
MNPNGPESPPRFSLVIPARNEEKYLPAVLESARIAIDRYKGGCERIEVIVADNVSTDRTADIAREFGCRVATVEKRVIGAVRNGGARLARGKYLCFADADNPLHPDTFNELDRLLARPRVACGGLGGWPERWSPAMALFIGLMYPLLIWVCGINGGVVYCRREDFHAVGGYDESMLIAEDVKFVRAVKQLARSRRQRFAATSRAPVTISVRKVDQFGEWHLMKSMFRAAWWYAFDRARIQAWAHEFWYADRR